MSWLVRICLCLVFCTPVATLLSPPAASQELPYATAVKLQDVIDVLHCPSCSVELMETTKQYYVRTAEGINVRFAFEPDAWHAARLLNSMVEASDRCDAETYHLALEQYTETVEMQREGDSDWNAGNLRLLEPADDLASLAMYVVPPFHSCSPRVTAKPPHLNHTIHIRTKSAKHRRGPIVSLR